MRCLIIHPGGLGDVLLAIDAIRRISRRPGVEEMGLLAVRQIGELLQKYGEVNCVFSLESAAMAELLSGAEDVRSPFVSWLRTCDLAVCWMTDDDGHVTAALTHRGVRQIVVQSAMAGTFTSRHQADRYVETIRCIGGEDGLDRPIRLGAGWYVNSVSMEPKTFPKWDGQVHANYAVVHPGSGASYKCCDPSIFVPVLQWLTQTGVHPIVVQGPADEHYVNRLQAHCPEPLHILNNHDLTCVADIIAQARIYIGHDSGITHLAAALGAPVVACFGPTHEERWGSRGDFVKVVRGGRCQCITLDAVRQCREQPCLNISSEVLLAACETMLRPLLPL